MNTTGKCKRYQNKGKPHHWMIPMPDGKESTGVCKYCKATSVFMNSFDYTNWNWRSEWSSKKDNKKLSSAKKGAV